MASSALTQVQHTKSHSIYIKGEEIVIYFRIPDKIFTFHLHYLNNKVYLIVCSYR